MSEARSLVNRLQTDAGEQEKLLEQKQLEAKSALQKITDTIKSAGTKRGELQTLRSTIAQENEALVERYGISTFSRRPSSGFLCFFFRRTTIRNRKRPSFSPLSPGERAHHKIVRPQMSWSKTTFSQVSAC